MVRRFKVPGFAKSSFSANELSGWQDGIAYTPAEMKDLEAERKVKSAAKRKVSKALMQGTLAQQIPAEHLTLGDNVLG